ncbi:MAG: hypothetical protein AAFX94_11180, partial [Myxococcota bacterium]
GKFEQTLQLGEVRLESEGAADIMVAKYDAEGEIEWVRHFGGEGEDNIFDVATDNEGHIYLSGGFSSTVQFDGFSLSAQEADAVFVKLGPNGDVLWARSAGGAAQDGGNELTVSPLGPVVAGVQSNGGFAIDQFKFTPRGQSDSYVVALNPADGSAIWALQVPANQFSRTKCLTVDPDGYIYNGGDFGGTIEGLETEAARTDAFLTRISPDGVPQWIRSWGGARDDLCKGVSATRSRVFVTGYFTGTLEFAGETFTAQGEKDQFVLGLSPDGDAQWAAQVSSSQELEGSELELDTTGGPLFAINAATEFSVLSSKNDQPLALEPATPTLLRFSPEGDLLGVLRPETGLDPGLPSEIAVAAGFVYVDSPFSGSTGTKDARILKASLSNLVVEPPTFRVSVEGGQGSGRYAAGEVVYISARVDPFTEAHLEWSGDVDVLESPYEWHARFPMPARDVQLTAEVRTVEFSRQDTTYIGTTETAKTMRLFRPASPAVGLILLLHGTNGNSQLVEKAEVRSLILDALERGYTVAAIDSEETASQVDLNGDGKLRWNTLLEPDNADLANTDAVLAGLRADGSLTSNMSVHALGMSNGGGMATALGAVSASDVAENFPELRFASVASMCAAGQASAGVTETPTGWWMCGQQRESGLKNS